MILRNAFWHTTLINDSPELCSYAGLFSPLKWIWSGKIISKPALEKYLIHEKVTTQMLWPAKGIKLVRLQIDHKEQDQRNARRCSSKIVNPLMFLERDLESFFSCWDLDNTLSWPKKLTLILAGPWVGKKCLYYLAVLRWLISILRVDYDRERMRAFL